MDFKRKKEDIEELNYYNEAAITVLINDTLINDYKYGIILNNLSEKDSPINILCFNSS